MKSVVLIGDSIRMGYQQYVAEELKTEAQLWWPEENGGTAGEILDRLDEWVLSSPPDVVHVNAGLHDIKRPRIAPRGSAGSNVSPEDYRINVQKILGAIGRNPKTQVFWATTTPVIDERRGLDRSEVDVLRYNQIAVDVAARLGVDVNDLHDKVMDGGHQRLLGPDGCHFTDEGYRFLGSAVARFLRTKLALQPTGAG